jgi:hypothetical protein
VSVLVSILNLELITTNSLIDILLLAINGQFTSSYTGPLNAHNEALTPKEYHYVFRAEREARHAATKGTKRDRSGFKAVKNVMKLGRSGVADVEADEMWRKLWKCGTSESAVFHTMWL